MISLDILENFNPKFSVVSCFIEYQSKILVLKRHPDKPQGESWGLPSGKVDPHESEFTAMHREVFEETGIRISGREVKHGKKMYVRYPEYDFIFHTFSVLLSDKPEVTLNATEHTDFAWSSKDEISQLPLIPYFLESMELHYK